MLAFFDEDAIADERWLDELLMPDADPRVLGVRGEPRPSSFYAENRLPGRPIRVEAWHLKTKTIALSIEGLGRYWQLKSGEFLDAYPDACAILSAE
ncbi:hypothetical protein NKJ36_29230 [Mesorhizobium sp. M0142]|uniref:hypothetical protein n=1 Tax=Mesorhizobium sp. M0142 TaxID=2956894 RepID=UPI00333B18AD